MYGLGSIFPISVELGERGVASHLDAPPDGRLQVSEGDFDLIYLGRPSCS